MKKSLTHGFLPAVFALTLTIFVCADKCLAEGGFDLSSVGNMEGSFEGNVAGNMAGDIQSSVGASLNGYVQTGAVPGLAATTAASQVSQASSSAARHALCETRKMLHQPGYAAWHSNEGQTYMQSGCASGPGNLLTLP